MDIVLLVIGVALLAAVVALLAAVTRSMRGAGAAESPELVAERHANEIDRVRHEEAQERARLQQEDAERRAQLAERCAAAETSAQELRAQVQLLRDELEKVRAGHKAEAEARQEQERRESKVLQALAPVRETLGLMQGKVTQMEAQRQAQYGALSEQLTQARSAEEHLRVTTESLAGALRSNTVRGAWGEAQLRRLVEVAGLTQYVDFELQQSITSDAGGGRPDMVIRLPGDKSIAVDSKAPMAAYLEASEIPFTATGEEGARRKRLLDDHVKAVRGHIDALGRKRYWEGLQPSPEFVVAFIPSESLLSAALEADPALLDYSFEKHVALASPVNLWAVLKTVAYTWQEQAVTGEARALFQLGTQLYDRLATLAGHADRLRKSLQSTVEHYNKFANSLESRVLVTARRFPGIDETKLLPQAAVIEESPRMLTAPELDPGSAAERERPALPAPVIPAE
ncbi:MAG TPA: DNA recombination protein RmuC [Microbacteriaceae bacterium]|nr:DNA recombination protein RmuC [Microbacteriaceae bacterium]